jgi:hypothetical protein
VSDTIARCVKCQRALWTDELAAGCWACRRCEETTAEHLRALPALFQQASQLSSLMKGSRADTAGGTSTGSAAPLNIGVLNLTAKGGAVTLLQAIEDSWRRTLGWSMGETRHHTDIDGVTTFLTNNLRWACEKYPEVGQDLGTIERLRGALHSVDTGERGLRRFDVLCATDDCTGRMNININTAAATCTECGMDYDRDALMRLDSQYGANTIRSAA